MQAERVRGIVACVLASTLVACAGWDDCNAGEQRDCTRAVDGGGTQRGYQICTSSGAWSACVPVGTCSSPGAGTLPVYSRCTDDAQCGLAGCAVCGHYTGVKNTQGYGLCYTYCQNDADCAPTTPTTGVTARCILGQCTLFCRTGATCPRDTECLRWNSSKLATMYPSFAGLCE